MKLIMSQRKDLVFCVSEKQCVLFSVAPLECENGKNAYSVGVDGISLGVYKTNEIAKEWLERIYKFLLDKSRTSLEM